MDARTEPKRRNLVETKARILAAAVEAFTELGYAGAGLRDIALRAGIAPSLVSRYYGSKAALFELALIEVIERNTVFTWNKRDFGREMADLVADRSTTAITAMLVLALTSPESRQIASRVAEAHIIGPLAQWLGPPDADTRAMNMFSLLTGFTIQMRGLNEGAIPEASLAWLAESLQALVDQRA